MDDIPDLEECDVPQQNTNPVSKKVACKPIDEVNTISDEQVRTLFEFSTHYIIA